MKNRGIKIALIIILVILSIALITFMIIKLINKDMKFNLSLIGFGDKTEMLFQEEYEIEPLESINVDVSSANVRIEKTDTDKLLERYPCGEERFLSDKWGYFPSVSWSCCL